MSLNYKLREIADVTILDLSGRITIGDATHVTLHELVRNTVKAGNRNILLNLRDVTYMDSSGLGELISWHTTVSKQGGHLRVCEPTPRVYNLFVLTHLSFVLDVHDDEAAPLRAFTSNAATTG